MTTALEQIKVARRAIWDEEPAEIQKLPEIKAARGQAASTVLYATTKLSILITFLTHIRSIAREEVVDLATLKIVTEPYLEFHAGVYGNFYQMADTAEVVRLAKKGLAQANSLDDFAELMGELAIYLNRIDYWVDLHIPWAEFGEVFEQE